MKRHLTLLSITLFLTTGCSNNLDSMSISDKKDLNAPLYCHGETQCKLMWDRATFFVNAHSGFKIQLHNDTIIQTYNPPPHSPKLAFFITKEPLGNGKYQIWTKVNCNNIIGCQPAALPTILKAKRYIKSGKR